LHFDDPVPDDADIIRFGWVLVVKSRLAMWLFAALLIAGLVSLGFWQLRRAEEKQKMLDAVADALRQKIAQPLRSAEGGDATAYDWTAGRGHFLAAPALLLDNQRRGDQVGVRVFAVFQADGGRPLLVDLGWLPLPGDRRLPRVDIPKGELAVSGLLTPPPSAGIALGPPYAVVDAQGHGLPPANDGQSPHWLMTRVDIKALAAGLHLSLATRVLRLDPALPIGYPRDLDVLPNSLPPERHRGYAAQWFGMAVAAFLLFLYAGFRRRPQ
jgi:cytochrome oxidase assembly protein ShyY1